MKEYILYSFIFLYMDISFFWMIIGFLFASYSVIGNDSVQTLGTFISSNKKIKWQYLWIFTSLILIATLTWSWWTNSGDISYGRLATIPFIEIQWYHALAPLSLVILTRIGIPVSTSLLVLSAFASSLVFEKIIIKSAIGYGLAAVSAYILWIVVSKYFTSQQSEDTKYENHWRIFQWFATGFLWFSWLSHDMANIAVFLPRELSLAWLLFILAVFVTGLAYIFWNQGGKIQEIVVSKTNTSYIKSATLIDIFYAFLLLYFKELNDIPMSTTWVFVGMLTGRELAIATMMKTYNTKNVFPLIGKDIVKLLFGLGVSIVIAMGIQNIDVLGGLF